MSDHDINKKIDDGMNSNAIIGVLYSQSYQKKLEGSEKENNSKKVELMKTLQFFRKNW
jgi:hypothetical protein